MEEKKDIKKLFSKDKIKNNFTISKIILGVVGIAVVILITLFLNEENKR